MGTVPSSEALWGLGLPSLQTDHQPQDTTVAPNPFTAILPLLTAIPQGPEPKDKPTCYLVAKGLPTKLAEKVWSLDYVDMEKFFSTPCGAREARPSLQESLEGAFNQFQACQQQQKAQRRVLDVVTWARCFTLYIAVMAKRHADIVPSMVAHFHTVVKLHQKAPRSSAWREYDIQLWMEQAATEDRAWKEGDPWQYVSCLLGPGTSLDPFDLVEQAISQQQEPQQSPLSLLAQTQWKDQSQPGVLGKGKRLLDPNAGKAPASSGLPVKRAKKSALCKWFNKAPAGYPYGSECMFTHRCSNCGTLDEHGAPACRFPPKPPSTYTL